MQVHSVQQTFWYVCTSPGAGPCDRLGTKASIPVAGLVFASNCQIVSTSQGNVRMASPERCTGAGGAALSAELTRTPYGIPFDTTRTLPNFQASWRVAPPLHRRHP